MKSKKLQETQKIETSRISPRPKNGFASLSLLCSGASRSVRSWEAPHTSSTLGAEVKEKSDIFRKAMITLRFCKSSAKQPCSFLYLKVLKTAWSLAIFLCITFDMHMNERNVALKVSFGKHLPTRNKTFSQNGIGAIYSTIVLVLT